MIPTPSSQCGPTLLKFSDAHRRLAEYRICLERDVEGGIIPAPVFTTVDACYANLSVILDWARVELEAAGLATQQEVRMGQFLRGWSRLATRMFAATHQQHDLEKLERTAAEVAAGGRAVVERLWDWPEGGAHGESRLSRGASACRRLEVPCSRCVRPFAAGCVGCRSAG